MIFVMIWGNLFKFFYFFYIVLNFLVIFILVYDNDVDVWLVYYLGLGFFVIDFGDFGMFVKLERFIFC